MNTKEIVFTHPSRPFEAARSLPSSAQAAGSGAVAKPDLAPAGFRADDLGGLAAAVVEHVGLPVSGTAVAAFLESQGWADADARTRFGCADLLVLGNKLWERSWSRAPSLPASRPAAAGQGDLRLRGGYLLALAFTQVMTLALGGISFGTGYGFTTPEATTVGTCLLLGLLWANSFGQLLARDPLSLHLEGQNVLAGLAAFRVLGIAMATAILVAGGGLWLFAARPQIFPAAALGAGYFLLIALFWLEVNSLFVLDLAPYAVGAAGLALMTVSGIQLFAAVKLVPQLAPGVGLLLANFLMGTLLVAWWVARRRKSNPTRPLPRLAGMAVDQVSYFLYGCGMMTLIIVDRLVAWWAGAAPGLFAFQVRYEVGLGWALLGFLVALAVHEPLLGTLLQHLRLVQARWTLNDMGGYRRAARREYWMRFTIVSGLAVVSSLLVGWAVWRLAAASAWLRPFVPTEEGWYVFVWGLVGYALLAVAMFNTGLLVSMSRPSLVAVPLLAAIFVDLAVAWGAVVYTFVYACSVLGLVAGAAVLLLASTIQVQRVLRTPTLIAGA